MNYKIAFPHLSFRHHGGTKIYLEIANELAKKHHVELIAPQGYIRTPYEIAECIKKNEISVPFKNKYITYLIYLLHLIFKLRNYNYIILTSPVIYYSALFTKLLFHTNFIYIVQDIENKYKWNSFRKFLNFPILLTYYSRQMVAANDYLAQLLTTRFKRRPLFTFNVWLSDEFSSAMSASRKLYDLVYFPRKESWKCLNLFLEFMKKSSNNLRVLLISQDTTLMTSIQSILNNTRHQIVISKPNSIKEIINHFDSSKLLLFTSSKEGFALPPLEAMSRGVPPVLYPCGGPSVYTIDKYNCRYYTNVSEADSIISELLINDKLREQLGSNGKITSQKFTKAVELPKIIDFIEKRLVNKRIL